VGEESKHEVARVPVSSGIRAESLSVYFRQERQKEIREHSDTHIKWYQSGIMFVYCRQRRQEEDRALETL
jgi:hypothetical protein